MESIGRKDDMARPRMAPEDKRSMRVNVRVSASEAAALQQKAEAAGMNVHAFTRAAALGRRLPAASAGATDFETRHELRRIGTNLNQIAKAMNAGRDSLPHSLELACTQLTALLDRMMDDGPQGHERRP